MKRPNKCAGQKKDPGWVDPEAAVPSGQNLSLSRVQQAWQAFCEAVQGFGLWRVATEPEAGQGERLEGIQTVELPVKTTGVDHWFDVDLSGGSGR